MNDFETRLMVIWGRNRTSAFVLLIVLALMVGALEAVGIAALDGVCLELAERIALFGVAPYALIIAVCELSAAVSGGRE